MIKKLNSTIEKSDIPSCEMKTTDEFNNTINSWMYDSSKPGIDYLMATINIVEPDDYTDFIVPVDEETFKMTTRDGREKTFKITFGDIEDYPVLKVIDERQSRNYSCNIENGKYQVMLSSTDLFLNNGLTLHQSLFNDVDSFSVTDGEHNAYFYIEATKKTNKPYFIPFHDVLIDKISRLESLDDIDELFNILYASIKDSTISNYSVSLAGKDGYHNISVKNGYISHITRTVDGNSYSIDMQSTPYRLLKNGVELESKDSVIQKLIRK